MGSDRSSDDPWGIAASGRTGIITLMISQQVFLGDHIAVTG